MPRSRIDLQNVLEIIGCRIPALARPGLKRFLHNPRNIEKTDAARKEGLDGNFICGIQDRRGRPPTAQAIEGDIEAGKTLMGRRLEMKLTNGREIELP